MAREMALEPQHALASARQMMERGASHNAETADDDVKMDHSAGLSWRNCYRVLRLA